MHFSLRNKLIHGNTKKLLYAVIKNMTYSWQPLKHCRQYGTDQHSFTNDGISYETCYDHKTSDGIEVKGTSVLRNSDQICKYSKNTTEAYCPTTQWSSNDVCPDGMAFTKNSKVCHGWAHDNDKHSFPNWTKTQKQEWTCNDPNVSWKSVLSEKPNGTTWWVNGKCTNDKVDIIKYAKCPRYGHIVKLSHNGSYTHWKCGKPIVDANQFEFAPGDPNALYAQMMQNNDFKIIFEESNIYCSQKGRTLGVVSGFESWLDSPQTRGTCVADVSHVDCTFPDFVCKIPENERRTKNWVQKYLRGEKDDKEFKDFLFTKNNFKIRIHNEKIRNSAKLHFVISKDDKLKIPNFGITYGLDLSKDYQEYEFGAKYSTNLHLFKT